jgi:ABC-type multidrug transport system fused ATPase/permease subunit
MQNIPYEGTVLINGKNIREFSRDDLAQRVAYHGQNQFLFHDTIMGNLLIGNPSATPEKAKLLCETLGLDRILDRLSDGYETWIREGSTNLSGGERQGLCLVRTLLRPADMYIIDEYANHLDSTTLDRVNDYLKNMRASLILITHDPVNFADQTLEFNHGRVTL